MRSAADAHRRIAFGHHLVHQVDGPPLPQRAQRRAVLAARNLAEHRVRGVGGDARPLERNAVAPHGVVIPGAQHDGPVGNGGVEPARVEQAARSQAALVGGADDPLVVGMLGGESFHLGDDLVDRLAPPHLRPDRLQSAGQRMGMSVAERRHQEAAAEVDLLGALGLCVCSFAEGLDRSVDHRQRVGGLPVDAGPDRSATEERRGHPGNVPHPSARRAVPNTWRGTDTPLRTLGRRHRQWCGRLGRRVRAVGTRPGHPLRSRHPHRRARAHPLHRSGRRLHRGRRHRLPRAQRPHLPDAVPAVCGARHRHPGDRHVHVGARRRQRPRVRRRTRHRRAVSNVVDAHPAAVPADAGRDQALPRGGDPAAADRRRR